jgi:hypothetical protein
MWPSRRCRKDVREGSSQVSQKFATGPVSRAASLDVSDLSIYLVVRRRRKLNLVLHRASYFIESKANSKPVKAAVNTGNN